MQKGKNYQVPFVSIIYIVKFTKEKLFTKITLDEFNVKILLFMTQPEIFGDDLITDK